MPQQPAQTVNYAELAKSHGALTSIHESMGAIIPPQVERIQNALGVEFKQGNPLPDGGIASVGDHDTKIVQINDPQKFAEGPNQTKGHEITHLWQNSLPPPIMSKIPPDDPKHPYALDLDKLDALRKKGVSLAQLPREQGATIVQRWIAFPQDRARLQAWLDDLNTTPLSLMMPTDSSAKTINRSVRAPIPPIEAYLSLPEMKAKAAELQKKFRKPGAAK